jgi:imidazole glycerol-phosphate synthase subunit HisH
MIVIIDYGMGNVRSLMNAFDFIGEEAVVTSDKSEIAEADRLVLPGVGAFGDAMDAVRDSGLRDILDDQALNIKKPILGVCLGMQLFAKSSIEHGTHEGLGWLNADILPLDVKPPAKVPHVGWNEIEFDPDHWLFREIPQVQTDFYFVHSLHMVCHEPVDRIATCNHGGSVTAAVHKGNLVATQFHPEKSQDNGLQLIQNWMGHDFTDI